jgi:hypothetical protein
LGLFAQLLDEANLEIDDHPAAQQPHASDATAARSPGCDQGKLILGPDLDAPLQEFEP